MMGEWLVDWHLPERPTRYQNRFYSQLRKVRKDVGGNILFVASAARIVDNKKLAYRIYELARDNNALEASLHKISEGLREVHRYESAY